jgi:peptidoglycan/LPS O-acetylase OafA/YrhL
MHHLNTHLPYPKLDSVLNNDPEIGIGAIGVSLFIILSGASLMMSTSNSFELGNFYLKRFYAIYPTYWLAYACAALFIVEKVPTIGHPERLLLTVFAFDGFLLYRIENYYLVGEWFIGFIIIMYLIFPALRAAFNRNRLVTLGLAVIVSLSTVMFYKGDMSVYRFPPARLFEFVFGMWFVSRFRPDKRARQGLTGLILSVSASMVYFSSIPGIAKATLLGTTFFCAISLISSYIECSLMRRIVGFGGRYSYGTFLVHHVLLKRIIKGYQGEISDCIEYITLYIAVVAGSYGISYILTNIARASLRKFRNA